ncbi:MAG: Maf family protein [Paracoccaceae bacterium]
MILLASASEIRLSLLRAAQIPVQARPARIDEEAIRIALQSEGATARDLADTLAEMKARKVAEKVPDLLVLGCDQVLELAGKVFAKPDNLQEAHAQLQALRGQTHHLHSAAVLYENGQPVWRHVGKARLTMHNISDSYLDDYLTRNWDSIRHSVGCYKLEEEGVRLFSAIEGDHFTILGLPLLPLLSYLSTRGLIPT